MCRNSKLCWEYMKDPFNIIDQVTITISFAAWGLRWAAFLLPDERRWMISARYLLSFDFMLYMFRFLEFFYQNKFLGPILVFFRHMVKTFLHFLLILMIFLVAYAIASESILYPETELTPINVYNIFRKGFWAMIGEYWLDEISGDDCANDSNVHNNLTNQRCPTADGRFTVPVLLGLYAVFVQILMFNLLIALFTQRDQIWRYQRFQLTMQYSETRILLPPFTPLIIFLNSRVGNPFISTIPEQYIALKHFEHTAAQKIIKKIIDYRIKNVSKSTVLKFILSTIITIHCLGKDLLDAEKKVNINSVDATTKEILQLLKKERRGSVTSEATQKNEMPVPVGDFPNTNNFPKVILVDSNDQHETRDANQSNVLNFLAYVYFASSIYLISLSVWCVSWVYSLNIVADLGRFDLGRKLQIDMCEDLTRH
ncbi:hypothetical protein Btru_038748 [Bulinus truncatus]|nr:hypothetical protein Btru_038748 [Bulinus truncatus]